MKYSISILFLLTIFAAIEAALYRRLEWPMLITVGLCLTLFWTHWQSRHLQSPKFGMPQGMIGVTAVCVIAVISGILFGATDKSEKLLIGNPKMVSANSVLILATLLLSSSLVYIPKRSFKLNRIVASTFIVFGLILCLGYFADPATWLVYIACRSIENSLLDPQGILGKTRVLLYGSAAFKAVVGVLGWCAWVSVAVFSYRRVQRKSSGLFTEVWIACGLGCLATCFQCSYLLEDFPELRESLSVLLYGTYKFNMVLLLILGVTGFFQYSMIDRKAEQPAERPMVSSDQVWHHRLRGITMMLPLLSMLGLRLMNMDWFVIGWLGWIIVASELFSNESLMLIALLLLGGRVIANAKNGPAKFLPIAPLSLFQLLVIGCVLVVFVPAHFAASQFYFNAVLMLSPRY